MVPAHASVHLQLVILPVFLLVVEVGAQHLRRLQAAPTSAEASAAPAESAPVDVLGIAESEHAELVFEAHRHGAGGVAVLGSVGQVGVGDETLVHALLHTEVENGLFLAVVDAGDTGQVALLVIRFHLFYNGCGQVLQCRLGVAHHEFLAVHENLLHLLAVDGDVAVVVNLCSWQALYQLLHHRPLWSAVGRGVVDECVLLCRHFQRASGHGGSLQHYGVRLHGDCSCGGFSPPAQADVLVHGLEADARHLQNVLAVGGSLHAERAVCGGQAALHHCAVCLQEFHRRHGQRLAGVALGHRARYGPLGHGRDCCRRDGNQH